MPLYFTRRMVIGIPSIIVTEENDYHHHHYWILSTAADCLNDPIPSDNNTGTFVITGIL